MEEYCLDANIFIDAWNQSYPMKSFPSLWKEIDNHQKDIVLIKPIYDEIDPMSSADKELSLQDKKEKFPLRMWLDGKGFQATAIDNKVQENSLILEKKYQVKEESKGANRNDITLIAYAKIMGKTVVTFERIQTQIPGKKYNYKIPLICKEENVNCIDFVGLLEKLNIRI